ncbi:uncharacterized protein LOC114256423 [Camellia sinensis]|uniref:uncharacterized protein LOC114256423 n=1 Tax=Camellia sinensis TaxID=4442 RepID=UPI001036A2B6|nr:uncharacterized protein LOC114256423 [Camellia sinensis]
MVSMLSRVTKSTKVGGRRSRDLVYVAAVPLRAAKGPAQLIMSSAYSLNLWGLQHFMVLIKPSSSSPPLSQASVFDFQPQDPENIYVALAALSGRKIPGMPLDIFKIFVSFFVLVFERVIFGENWAELRDRLCDPKYARLCKKANGENLVTR